ncbi:BgTH12-00091 [Blumeria graminis f. sp. triticale]|uniref:BgTH12-00091 n=1 Tax=Blumeria graminis f. sp. triticale TaxID=1689686 RepID=A0A9W4D5K8_BLUGR|nr:BgTH12-00091 [Blumeria graminis f. sp. triticale]
MSGGVQTLRAMFEQSSNASSPDRGRSGDNSAGIGETPQRPLSTVRTSFVKVERNGHSHNQSGIRKDISNESNTLQRNSITKESNKKNLLNTPIIKSNVLVRGAHENDRKNSKKLEKELETKGDEKSRTSVTKSPTTLNSLAKRPKNVVDKASLKTVSSLSHSKTKKSPMYPQNVLPKSPATPSRRTQEDKDPITKQNKVSVTKTSSRNLPNSPKESTPRSTGRMKSHASPSRIQSRFQKPQPKSPTKPVKLPTSLTTQTASSSSKVSRAVTKTETSHDTLGKLQNPSRSSRRLSISSRGSSALKGDNSRPSLGLGELSRKSSRQSLVSHVATDESFLARMMRPTTSSASKSAEKPLPIKQIKPVSRPATKNGLRITTKAQTKKSVTNSSITNGRKEFIKIKVEEHCNPIIISTTIVSPGHENVKTPSPTCLKLDKETPVMPPQLIQSIKSTEPSNETIQPETVTKSCSFNFISNEEENISQLSVTMKSESSEEKEIEGDQELETNSISIKSADLDKEIYLETTNKIIGNPLDEKTPDPTLLAVESNQSEASKETETCIEAIPVDETKKVDLTVEIDNNDQDHELVSEELTIHKATTELEIQCSSKTTSPVLESKSQLDGEEMIVKTEPQQKSPIIKSPLAAIRKVFKADLAVPTTSQPPSSPSHHTIPNSGSINSLALDRSPICEDPEDIRAREEIAKLNEALMMGAH